ncbi:MAG: 16S rRNA (adenine(1518)-N(6)/adenine(1519)-N(6))-dimethyltransferase RsmA [Hyphomicrobiales bacterium]
MSHSFDNLPPLREVLVQFDLNPKKSLGQNFLLDLNLTSRIARSAGRLQDANILEIGPGPGGLTRAILKENPASVTVIERDDRCIAALEQVSAHYPGKLHIIAGDALLDQPQMDFGLQTRIIANLPYNIATPLLIGWLETEPWPPFFASMTLMFQKEVADRIVAAPGSRTYGRLAVLAQWRCTTEQLFDVPPQAFTPPPKVTSSVVHLEPRAEPLPCRLKSLTAVTAAAFGQRRKMLRQSLKSVGVTNQIFEQTGISPMERAEQIPVSGFVALANALDAVK